MGVENLGSVDVTVDGVISSKGDEHLTVGAALLTGVLGSSVLLANMVSGGGYTGRFRGVGDTEGGECDEDRIG